MRMLHGVLLTGAVLGAFLFAQGAMSHSFTKYGKDLTPQELQQIADMVQGGQCRDRTNWFTFHPTWTIWKAPTCIRR